VLLAGDGWAEDHHDVELQDGAGRRLGRARLPEEQAQAVKVVARAHQTLIWERHRHITTKISKPPLDSQRPWGV
jgi:hypothetical protein